MAIIAHIVEPTRICDKDQKKLKQIAQSWTKLGFDGNEYVIHHTDALSSVCPLCSRQEIKWDWST